MNFSLTVSVVKHFTLATTIVLSLGINQNNIPQPDTTATFKSQISLLNCGTLDTILVDIDNPGSETRCDATSLPGNQSGTVTTPEGVSFELFGYPQTTNFRDRGIVDPLLTDFVFNNVENGGVGLRIYNLPAGIYDMESWHYDAKVGFTEGNINIEISKQGTSGVEVVRNHEWGIQPAKYRIISDGQSVYEVFFRENHTNNRVRLNGFRLSCSNALPDTRPNIVVLLTDDQGWGDIGYNNPAVYTPNLDSLAAQGITFSQHYVMPQCTPTRVALMTGRYPSRFSGAALAASNAPVFPLGTPTLASTLQANGYETYTAGKWHMGSDSVFGPNNFGFDHSYGSLAGAVGMYNHIYANPSNQYSITWHRDLEIIDGYENGEHATDLVTEDAIRFVERYHEKPFFMYMAYHAVHTPLDERGQFVDIPTQLDPDNPDRWLNEDLIEWFNDPDGKIQAEPDPEKRLLLAVANHLDHAIGQLIDALKQTGQYENTIILFSSDNGPQVNWPGNAYPDDLKVTNFNQPIPFRGSKLHTYEGGIHVPGFMVWEKEIEPDTIDTPVHIVDWFPTIKEIVGDTTSQNIDFDGIDLTNLALEGEIPPTRDIYWFGKS